MYYLLVICVGIPLLAGCGQDEPKRQSHRGSEEPPSSGDDALDYGDAPEKAKSGGTWTCTFYGEGSDGFSTLWFEDVYEMCFDGLDDASDYTDSWTADCMAAFQDDGYSSIYCEATCDDAEDPC
jgi:hypothetical protein